MKMGGLQARGQKSSPLAVGTLAAVFLASRLMYFLGGVRFDGDLLRSSWALLDPHLLESDLFRSIMYLHIQPPLFNLFVALVLKAAPANSMAIFRILNIGVGMLLAFSLYETMCRLHVPFWFSITLTIAFVVSPATILFENILFYTYPLALALVVSTLLLEGFLRTNRLVFAWLFFCRFGDHCLDKKSLSPDLVSPDCGWTDLPATTSSASTSGCSCSAPGSDHRMDSEEPDSFWHVSRQ